jgi:hypothetical protein
MCHSCGSRNPVFSASFGLFYFWIPTFVGMTAFWTAFVKERQPDFGIMTKLSKKL